MNAYQLDETLFEFSSSICNDDEIIIDNNARMMSIVFTPRLNRIFLLSYYHRFDY